MLKKHITKTAKGNVDFLVDGQFFVAVGKHKSGVQLQWIVPGGAASVPDDFPTITSEQFLAMQREIEETLGGGTVSPVADTDAAESTDPDFVPATEIGDADLDMLREVLEFPPLIKAAEDNSVWSEVGYALISTGRVDLWQTFSQHHRYMSDYDHEAAMVWWRAHQDSVPRTDFTHIILMAKRLGWKQVEFGDLVGDPLVDDDTSSLEGFVGEMPAHRYDTTDLGHAHRLKDEYAPKELIVSRKSFFGYNRKVWNESESEAHRRAANLSGLIQRDIDDAKERLDYLAQDNREWQVLAIDSIARPDKSAAVKHFASTPKGKATLEAYQRLDDLMKDQKNCEQQPVQARAVKLLENTLEPNPPIKLDKDRHLFNVNNGTVDLRTGTLLPHNPLDFITKISPVDFKLDAQCPRFEKFLQDCLPDDEVRKFVQRWYGYCASGETNETVIQLAIGPGGNGKSTLIDAISGVLGDYAQPAPRGLLMRGSERQHPSGLADLAGSRLSVISETGAADELNEEFLKQMVSVEDIKARRMYGEWFTFSPSHKFVIQTNKRPVIIGQDFGIWRRLLLVYFPVRFGKPEDVASGNADKRRDENLMTALREEREGILAWIVRGAVEWYRSGLKPPASVIQAVDDYQNESNRIGHFVEDCCVLGADQTCRPAELYSAYTYWCRDNGYRPLGSGRFYQDFAQSVPQVKRIERKEVQPNGKRKSVYLYEGLNVDSSADMATPTAMLGSISSQQKHGALI